MFSRRNCLVALSPFSLGTLVAGCASAPPSAPPVAVQAPKYSWGSPVEFENMYFEFNAAQTVTSFRNWVNQTTYADEAFIIVNVTMMNKTNAPLPFHFQPIYRLLDSAGAIYEPHQQHTIGINMGRPGRGPYGQSMNPNTRLSRELVFEVPRKKYELQVLVPSRASVGFAGNVSSSGRFFIYEISSQLES